MGGGSQWDNKMKARKKKKKFKWSRQECRFLSKKCVFVLREMKLKRFLAIIILNKKTEKMLKT